LSRNRALFCAALGAALVLGGCGGDGFLDSKIDYKSAGSLPPLDVPPDLTVPSRDNRYTLPEAAKSTATLSGYQADRKESRTGTALLPPVENIRLERVGAERWVVVQEPPEKVWPMVKDFWQENGFLVKTEILDAGVMETDWAEKRADIQETGVRSLFSRFLNQSYATSERDKFRTRLERTPDGKGTEIYISHRGMEEVYKNKNDVTAWQPRPSDPGLEAEFLRRLMVRLGARDERAKQLASTPPTAQRAELKKATDGSELLQVNEPFDRAWRRIGLALDRVGFTVEDRDRQNGVYFVRYADPEQEMEKPGLLSKLFDSKDSKIKAEQYRVQVKPEQEASRVHVLNRNGAPDSSKTAERILTLLHEQLK
jgi:outer membrane protein assembly factor BamC